jgi:hypothetical protein
MDSAARARMQIRIVLIVWRIEMARLAKLDLSPADRLEWEDGLRARSLALLDGALEQLDAAHASRSEVRQQLRSARAEVNRQVA